MADVGTATIRILGDSSGFERTINNLGRNAGGFLGNADRIGTKFGEGVGRATGRALRIGLLAAAGGVALAVGKTLSAGFKRFTTIEDATRSLTLLLGDAAKAGALLDKTLAVVEGTPFALEDFVDASRNLVANNVQLAKVPRVLQAIADAAAASGGTADDVNNVADSFGRIATGATLSLQPIRELEQKGVPALRILANQAGISAEQMAKDITAGSVDSQKAIDDLTEGILNGTDGIAGATVAYGGAAKEVGNTVSGAFSNMRTAIARAGANIIKVFADSGKGGEGLVRIINGMRDSIDVLGKAGVRLAENFAEGGGLDKVVAFFEDLPARLAQITSAGSFDEFVSNVVDQIRGAFQRIPTAKLSDLFVTLFSRALEGLATGAAAITAAVIKHAPAIIKGVLEGLVRAAAANPLNTALFLGALGIPGVGAALAGFFKFLPFGSIVAPLITGLTKAIQGGIGAVFGGAGGGAAGGGLAALFASPAVLAAIGGAVATLGAFLVSKIGGTLETVIKTLLAINPATRLFALLTEGFNRGFGKLLDIVVGFFSGTLPRFFTSTIPGVVAIVVRFFSEMPGKILSGIQAGFGAVFSFFQGLPGQILGAIGDLGGRLFDKGVELMNGLLDGLQSVAGSVFSFIADVAGRIAGAFQPDQAVTHHPGGGFGVSGSFHEGGLVMHKGGVVPRLHSGTLNRLAGNLGGSLRHDERRAILQVGELVLSKNQVAQARAGVGSSGHTFNIYEVGDGQTTAERIVNRLAVG